MTSEISRIVESVNDRSSVAAYLKAARRLRSRPEPLQPARIALLATFTIESLVPYLEVEAARRGFSADIYVGPFDSIHQELLDPRSGCVSHNPDVVFIAQELSHVCPAISDSYLAMSVGDVEDYAREVVSDLVETLRGFRKVSGAALVVHNFASSRHPLLGIHEVMSPRSQSEVIRAINLGLVEAARSIPGVYVLDYERLCADIGYRNWYDDRTWHLARAPLSSKALPVLARTQVAYLASLAGRTRKCLVLDLDNTLWGGVLGEEGITGIELGDVYPGSAFQQFQKFLLQLFQRGVMLAVNSKNNWEEVEEAFRVHRGMILKLDHFAGVRVNWNDKTQNIAELAEEINIGLDSMVFFDDSAVERALMEQVHPEVLTLNVPNDPLKYSAVISDSMAFDKLSFASEDRARGVMYRQQAARASLERSSGSLQEYYDGLALAVKIGPVDDFSLPRVVELIQKTNQFNLTSRRYTAAELSALRGDPTCTVFSLAASDRFGDYGTVGVAIVQVLGARAYLRNLLLSCRILGRKVETAFLWYIAKWAESVGADELEGEYVATPKNKPASEFYPLHGFSSLDGEYGGNGWRLKLDKNAPRCPSHIELKDNTFCRRSVAG